MLVPDVFANLVDEVESNEILELLAEILLSIVSKFTACVTVTKSVFASILVISQALVQIPDISWSPVLVQVAVPQPVAKLPSLNAVLNCAVVPEIPTIVDWSPVLVPERLPSKATVSVFGVVPAVIVKPTVSVDTGLVTFNSGVQSV